MSEPPDQTFSKFKKKFGGENLKKYAKVWAGGAHSVCALHFLAFFLKMGSSGVVKFHQHGKLFL
ncbi:hypothetical protein H6801_02445 [Candidatus Nomurabacteria bacterium]|nr:hypothetical protein [Candidatus Nomurabacteria bacterium]